MNKLRTLSPQRLRRTAGVAKPTALGGKVSLAGLNASSSAAAASKLGETVKVELKERGQEVISRAQIQDLNKVLGLIEAVLANRRNPYYVVVDGLDEDWVEDRLRYKLIMALIVTARDFVGIARAKVLIALRRDLLDRVFRLARDSGFQEEKYRSLYLPLTWSKSDLLAARGESP